MEKPETMPVATEVASPKAPELPPEELAANDWDNLMPEFTRLLNSKDVSRGGLARAFKCAVQFPLADNYPTFIHHKEQELFKLALHLLDCKGVMFQKVLKDRLNKKEGETNVNETKMD